MVAMDRGLGRLGRFIVGAACAAALFGCPPPVVIDGGTDMGTDTGMDGGGTDAGGGLCDGITPVPGTPALTATMVASGLDKPLVITHAPGDTARLFIVEQDGRVRVVENGTLLPTPFLDITPLVAGPAFPGGETGFLGLAFHPDYATNRRFFVHYSASGTEATVVAEYAGTGDPNVADPASATVIFGVSAAVRQSQRRSAGVRARRLPLHRAG